MAKSRGRQKPPPRAKPAQPAPLTPSQCVAQFFARFLTHGKGELAGQPFTLADWQLRDIVQPLFDTRRPDGLRQYRTAYVEIPRKNGKTTLAAGLALYLLFADGEPGAEVVSAAADREQASICFDLAKAMVEGCPELASRCTVYRKEIVTNKGGRYRAISSEAATKHGFNLSGIVFDELHCQPDRELWDTLTTATGSRRQPLTFGITTAGHDRESLCWELHTYSRSLLDGTIEDPGFLPVIYSSDGDWREESTWREANPGFGVSVHSDYFRQQVVEAQSSPGKEQAFRRLHLNQWTDSETRWIALEKWDEGKAETPDLRGRQCWAGLDLSSTTDLSALVLAFPVDGTIWLVPHCWAPRAALQYREKRNKTRFDNWARSGHLEITDGEVIDYERIRAKVLELKKVYNIRDVAVDRWNAAQLSQQLLSDGVEMVNFGMGWATMSPAAKDFEALVLGGKIRHTGHPVLRWCMGNTMIEHDSQGNYRPSKKRSSEKIDLAVASIMATARARVQAVANSSVYEERGLRFL